MLRTDISFLLMGVLCFVISLTAGVALSVAHDFQLALIHAGLGVIGFASLSVFGLTYKLYSALQRSRLAGPHFATSSLGALVFPFAIDIAMRHEFPLAASSGFLLLLGGAVLFTANLILNVALSAAPGIARAVPWAA